MQKETINEEKGQNIIEKYIQRPECYEMMSLLQFAKTINVRGSKYYHARKENIVIVYPIINENDESKIEEFYKQQCVLHIPFTQSLPDFFNQIVENEEESWKSIFDKHNLGIVNIDLIYNEYFEQESEIEETSYIETNNENSQLNAFELLSSLHNEKYYKKLGQQYIDISYDWIRHDEKKKRIQLK